MRLEFIIDSSDMLHLRLALVATIKIKAIDIVACLALPLKGNARHIAHILQLLNAWQKFTHLQLFVAKSATTSTQHKQQKRVANHQKKVFHQVLPCQSLLKAP